jgi:hypothetical protein
MDDWSCDIWCNLLIEPNADREYLLSGKIFMTRHIGVRQSELDDVLFQAVGDLRNWNWNWNLLN